MGKVIKLIFFLLGITFFFLLGTQKTQAAGANIVINEVMANAPAPETDLEWVELYNPTNQDIDLQNWTFDGKVISLNSLVIPAENFLILARDKAAFLVQWPGVTAPIVEISFSLSNAADTVILEKDFSYREEFSWEENSAGDNISWERIDSLVSSDENWLPSSVIGGTPGMENSVSNLPVPLSPILLAPQNNQEFVNPKTIEFTWQIQTGLKYEFVLSKTADFSDYIYDEINLTVGEFTLDDLEKGTYFWKIISDNGVDEAVSEVYTFKVLEPIYSDTIIISEICPDPLSGEEWIELYNNSAEDVNLRNWIFKDLGSTSHTINLDLIVPAHGYLLIPKLQNGITLNNDQDKVYLLKPSGEVLDETPIFSDGEKGWSFVRDLFGRWSWTTSPTPGTANLVTVPEEEVSEETDDESEDVPKNDTPLEIKTGEISAYENYLVKISGEVVETSGNTFYLDDGSGRAKIYIQESTGIDKPPMHKGDIFQIIGIVDFYRGVWRVLPQKQDDIKLIKLKNDEDTVPATAKKSTAKVSSSSAKKVASATTKARAPTGKEIASEGLLETKIQSYRSPFWVQMIKAFAGLSIVLLVLLILKVIQIKREYPWDKKPLGGDFGNDFT